MRTSVVPLALVVALAGTGCRKKSEAPPPTEGARTPNASGAATPEQPGSAGDDGTEGEARSPRETKIEEAYRRLVAGEESAGQIVLALGDDAGIVVERAIDSQNVTAIMGALPLLPKVKTEKGQDLLATAFGNTAAQVRAAALDLSAAGPYHLPAASVRGALDDAEVEVRATACDTLAASANDPDALAGVAARLGDVEPVVRAACAAAFGKLAAPAEWLPKLATQLESPNAALREGTVRALGEFRVPEAYDFIRGRLADPDANVVATAIAATSRYADENAARDIEPFLKDERRSVRIEAAVGLSRLPPATVRNALYETLKDRDAAVRVEAAAALVRYPDDPETFIRLHALLRDEEGAVRDMTADVLTELHDARSFTAVAARLPDEPVAPVREKLIYALSAIDATRAVPVLIDRIGIAKGEEATALLVVLRERTGQSFPMEAAPWKAWYAKTHPEGAPPPPDGPVAPPPAPAAPEAPPAPAAPGAPEAPAAPAAPAAPPAP